MFESVRVRLTLWYTGVLALALAALATAAYLVLRQTFVQHTDSSLAELSDAFLVTFDAELNDQILRHSESDFPHAAAKEAITEFRFRDHLLAVLDAEANLTAFSDVSWLFPDASVAKKLIAAAATPGQPYKTLRDGREHIRSFVRRFPVGRQEYTLVILQSLRSQEEELRELGRTFLFGIPLVVLLASAGGYFLARKSLAPVVAMSTHAGRIGAANLHERLPVLNESDELGHLARAFNDLLDRLDKSFERQRRFMADASHELRTPVAILRGEAEVALGPSVRSPEEYRESLEILREEAQRLSHIVEDLFTLARADAGQLPLTRREFYLDEMLADCARAARSLALGKHIQLACEVDEELLICADETLLRRMTMNLLDNAIKYTPEGGRVTIECQGRGGNYILSVSDTGPGIPAEARPRVFERFYRVDKARSRAENDGGAGLGLSIAHWIAEAHHGRLELVRSDSGGSTFTAHLPAAAPGVTPATNGAS